MVDCLIAFGANEGDTESNFRRAAERLRMLDGIEVIAVSEPYPTEPIGGPEGQSQYLNASIRVATELSANELHQRLVEIETKLGRERRVRWGSRKIDLDLLLYGDQRIQTEALIVPHPRMSFRRFVLEPCLKIAGDMTHPTSGQTIAQLLDILDRRANVAVFVNATAEFLDSLSQKDSVEDWKFMQASNRDQLKELETTAKLIVVLSGSGGLGGTGDLVADALKFAGSMLDLRTSENAVEEIVAALSATK